MTAIRLPTKPRSRDRLSGMLSKQAAKQMKTLRWTLLAVGVFIIAIAGVAWLATKARADEWRADPRLAHAIPADEMVKATVQLLIGVAFGALAIGMSFTARRWPLFSAALPTVLYGATLAIGLVVLASRGTVALPIWDIMFLLGFLGGIYAALAYRKTTALLAAVAAAAEATEAEPAVEV